MVKKKAKKSPAVESPVPTEHNYRVVMTHIIWMDCQGPETTTQKWRVEVGGLSDFLAANGYKALSRGDAGELVGILLAANKRKQMKSKQMKSKRKKSKLMKSKRMLIEDFLFTRGFPQ